jgi:hypothetical protein
MCELDVGMSILPTRRRFPSLVYARLRGCFVPRHRMYYPEHVRTPEIADGMSVERSFLG